MTTQVTLGTAIALAFNRSPMSIASTASDLQTLTQGRFMIGLGAQVRAHIERRFSNSWDRPAARMREVIPSLRAIWDCWKTGGPLDFQEEFYQFSIMTPAFRPPPMPYPVPPIYLGGGNTQVTSSPARWAAASTSIRSTRRGISARWSCPTWPMAQARPAAASPMSRMFLGFLRDRRYGRGNGDGPRERTPAAVVLCIDEGLSRRPVGTRLGGCRRQPAAVGGTSGMGSDARLISDEIIGTFAVTGRTGDIAAQLKEKYAGLLDRVAINSGPQAGSLIHDAWLAWIASEFHR